MASSPNIISPLNHPLEQYPVAFIDYLFIVFICITIGFTMAIIIDGYIFDKFDKEEESKQSSLYIYSKLLFQFAVQGFIVILIWSFLISVPSPFENIYNYNSKSTLGMLIRNPAIITIILFTLSISLRERLFYLFSRFT
jgi:hypothetical protein